MKNKRMLRLYSMISSQPGQAGFRWRLTCAGSAVCYAEGEYGVEGDAGGRREFVGGGGD